MGFESQFPGSARGVVTMVGTWEGQMTADLNGMVGCGNHFDICNDVFFFGNMLLSLLLISFSPFENEEFQVVCFEQSELTRFISLHWVDGLIFQILLLNLFFSASCLR